MLEIEVTYDASPAPAIRYYRLSWWQVLLSTPLVLSAIEVALVTYICVTMFRHDLDQIPVGRVTVGDHLAEAWVMLPIVAGLGMVAVAALLATRRFAQAPELVRLLILLGGLLHVAVLVASLMR